LLDIIRVVDICSSTFAVINVLLDMVSVFEVGKLAIRPLRLVDVAVLWEEMPDFMGFCFENFAGDCSLLLLGFLLPFK
jgi:hypothetical protein